jgi:hypothetical protein
MSRFDDYQQDNLLNYRPFNQRSEYNILIHIKEDDFKKNLNYRSDSQDL